MEPRCLQWKWQWPLLPRQSALTQQAAGVPRLAGLAASGVGSKISAPLVSPVAEPVASPAGLFFGQLQAQWVRASEPVTGYSVYCSQIDDLAGQVLWEPRDDHQEHLEGMGSCPTGPGRPCAGTPDPAGTIRVAGDIGLACLGTRSGLEDQEDPAALRDPIHPCEGGDNTQNRLGHLEDLADQAFHEDPGDLEDLAGPAGLEQHS